MEAKYTPTPWMLGRGSLVEIYAVDPDAPDDINSTDDRHVATVRRASGKSVAQSHADAEFIVRACNAHDDLVSALKACAAVCAGETTHKGGLIGALESARAALAKAEVGNE